MAEPEKAAAVREHINHVLEPDGRALTIVGGKAHLTECSSRRGAFINKVATLDFDTVQIEIARGRARYRSVSPDRHQEVQRRPMRLGAHEGVERLRR